MTKPLYEGFKPAPEEPGSWQHFIRFCVGLALALFFLTVLGS